MQVSLQSKFYFCACTVVATCNAYANPSIWITAFVISHFIGICEGYFYRSAAQSDNKRGNSGWNLYKIVQKETATELLAASMPGLGALIINLIALGLIKKRIPPLQSWYPRPEKSIYDLGTFFYGFAAGYCGHVVGNLFQLDMLRRSSDPEIQKLLEKAII